MDQKTRLQGYNRTLKILMEGATWALDCARVTPYLKGIVETIGEKAELRLIDRDTSSELGRTNDHGHPQSATRRHP